MNLGLDGKVALVTGSTRGIGNAIARRLAEEGARVVINGRDAQSVAAAVKAARAAAGIAADLTDAAATKTMLQSVSRDLGRLDILVCNVGSGASVPPGKESPEEWQRMLAVNLFSATNAVDSAAAMLCESQGVALCISSICGIEALGCPLGYSSAKAALNTYVRGMARVLGRNGVRINAIAPGNILFPGSVWEKKLEQDSGQVAAMLGKEVALGRLGRAEEVADLAAFLVSARSAFATGAIFVLDGGQLRS